MYYLEKTTTLDWSLLDNASIVADAHETAGHEYHYYSRNSCARRQAVPLENWWLQPCILFRCNSQTTQATELTPQIAPPTLQSSPIKEGTQHGTIRVSKDSDGFLQHSQ